MLVGRSLIIILFLTQFRDAKIKQLKQNLQLYSTVFTPQYYKFSAKCHNETPLGEITLLFMQ